MENEVKRNDCGKTDKFQFKEPIILSSILALMLICGINTGLVTSQRVYFRGQYEVLSVHRTSIAALGVLLLSILSATTGRKPTFISLSAASILVSCILHAFPNQKTCVMVAVILQKIITGGIFATTFLAIPEFCSPKHRFAYLLANMVAFTIGRDVTLLFFDVQVKSTVTMYSVLGFQLVIEIFCLGVAFVGPESPYWLARRDRIEESKRALLWLRGEGSEAELSSILKQHQHRNLRVFWLSLLAGMSAISVSAFTSQMMSFSVFFFSPMLKPEETHLARLGFAIVILPLITWISYKVKHKSIFLVTSIIPLVFVYVLAFWSYFGIVDDYNHITKFFRISLNFLLYFGPFSFGIVSYAEVIPSTYNTYVNCICFIYFYVMTSLKDHIFFFHWLPVYGLFTLGATLSLICVFIFYFSSPETKDKMLLDIQKLYTPRQRY